MYLLKIRKFQRLYFQPLRLSNVDENIAREVDDVLLQEYDKEQILRRVSCTLHIHSCLASIDVMQFASCQVEIKWLEYVLLLKKLYQYGRE